MGKDGPPGRPPTASAHRAVGLTKSFTNYYDRDFSPMRGAPMLEQEYALPGSKLHFAVANRDCLTCAGQCHSDMRWHVIAALGTMREIIGIFRHQTIEEFLQVTSRCGIGIFHDNDTATRVPNKYRNCPVADAALVDLGLDIAGDFVGAFASSANLELILVNTHRMLRITPAQTIVAR